MKIVKALRRLNTLEDRYINNTMKREKKSLKVDEIRHEMEVIFPLLDTNPFDAKNGVLTYYICGNILKRLNTLILKPEYADEMVKNDPYIRWLLEFGNYPVNVNHLMTNHSHHSHKITSYMDVFITDITDPIKSMVDSMSRLLDAIHSNDKEVIYKECEALISNLDFVSLVWFHTYAESYVNIKSSKDESLYVELACMSHGLRSMIKIVDNRETLLTSDDLDITFLGIGIYLDKIETILEDALYTIKYIFNK